MSTNSNQDHQINIEEQENYVSNIVNVNITENLIVTGNIELSTNSTILLSPFRTISFVNNSSVTTNGITYPLSNQFISNFTTDTMRVSLDENHQLTLLPLDLVGDNHPIIILYDEF